MENKFCRNCGAQLQPGDRFCQKCGQMTSESAGQQASGYQPGETHTQASETPPVGRRSSLPTVLAVLAVLLLAGLAWYRFYYPGMQGARTGASGPAGTGAGPGSPQGGQQFSGYAGTWVFPPEGGASSSMVVTLQEDRGTITGMGSDGSTTITMEFKNVVGGKLSGTVTGNGMTAPATAELSPDGNQLTLTAEDPPGTFHTITAQRQGASPSGSTVPSAPQSSPNTGSSVVPFERDAVSIVQQLPEVRDWVSRIGQYNARFDVIDETGDHYTIRVSEAPSGEGSQGSVFGTYTVEKATGRAYPSGP